MNLLAKAREHQVMPEIEKRRQLYSREYSPAERRALQLARFNAEWPEIRRTVPFYRQLAERSRLPRVFDSWEEILAAFPVLNRETIQQNRESMTSCLRPPQWWRRTGGSTAQPVHLPAWRSELRDSAPNGWLSKSWYGVQPSDRLFHIWGRGHFTDSGLKGWWKLSQRRCMDLVLGYRRLSAHNLSEEVLRKAGLAMLRFRPRHITGFSVALDRFALANQHLAPSFHQLRLKVVSGISEGFPRADSRDVIAKIFGAPVAMEYGANETDLLAHTTPHDGYSIFWDSYFCEAVEPGVTGGRKIRVTCLFPRCFPLIRYELGDEIELENGEEVLGVARFRHLTGRTFDVVTLADGNILHAHGFDVAVRACPEIIGYQAVLRDGKFSLNYLSSAPIPASRIQRVRELLPRIHPSLTDVDIRRTDRLEQTAGGKTKPLLKK